MQITIHEAPPVTGWRGYGLSDVFGFSFLAALLVGTGSLAIGYGLGRQDKDREINALKQQYGIVDDVPVPTPPPLPTR